MPVLTIDAALLWVNSYHGVFCLPLPPAHLSLPPPCLQRTFSASPYSDPIQVTPGVARSVEQPEMLWVMGPVLAVVLIIIIVIAILLFKR